MQKCPNCGYKSGANWPLVLWAISFNALWLLYILGGYQPREYKLIGAAIYTLFTIGTVGMAIRNKPTVPASEGMMRKGNND